jgi:hypothetical protein
VETAGLELVTHHPVIEPVSAPALGTEISYVETGRQKSAHHLAETASETCGK